MATEGSRAHGFLFLFMKRKVIPNDEACANASLRFLLTLRNKAQKEEKEQVFGKKDIGNKRQQGLPKSHKKR